MNPVKLLLITGVITLVAVVGIAMLFSRSNPQVDPDTPVDITLLIKEDSPTLGPKDAKVTIVEFLDPECEACRATYPLVKQVMAENEGKVRLVVRYFTLHGNSVLAMRATEIAGEQGKYWEMQQKLFENQTSWGEQKTPQTELFIKYASELGLNVDTFTEALKGSKYTDKINRDNSDGKTLDVSGTPSFFVNGKRLQNISTLSSVVKAELEK